MRKKGLSTEQFLTTVFDQTKENFYNCDLSTKANENGDYSLMYNYSNGIIYSYEHHVLGVVRIDKDTHEKHLFHPLIINSNYEQSKTTQRQHRLMIEVATEKRWRISNFIASMGNSYIDWSDNTYFTLQLPYSRVTIEDDREAVNVLNAIEHAGMDEYDKLIYYNNNKDRLLLNTFENRRLVFRCSARSTIGTSKKGFSNIDLEIYYDRSGILKTLHSEYEDGILV